MEIKHCIRCDQDHPLKEFLTPEHRQKRQSQLCRFCLETDQAATAVKDCSKCHQTLPVKDFTVKASGKRTSWCRSCAATYQREHRPCPVPVLRKICRLCHQDLDIGDFFHRTSSPDGHTSCCKVCHAQKVRSAKNKVLLYAPWGAVSIHTATRWMALHHVTYAELVDILKQKKCAICRQDFQKDRVGQIDHDHKTGQVRGLLCLHCNLLLGHAKDQPNILRAALTYLEKP